jgi:endoglucanase
MKTPKIVIAAACLLMLPLAALSQLPSPTYGWNLGNTLEPPGGEGTWGPPATQSLINGVAAAGFNTVRIPVAWNSHANQSTYQIDATWMARVKQVVDWCYAKNLYVIINSHWDNGWLENNITDSVNSTINAKQQAYWTQIANTFKTYDSHLLFASANEPNADTAAEMSTLLAYHQTFVNAVRATGGNNTTRWLVVQGPNTDIDLTDQLMNTMPSDTTAARLAVEVHFYSPYQFTLMTADADWGKMFYFWGQAYHHPTRIDRNANWGEETYVNDEFEKMRVKFSARGIPVIIGEFEALKRPVSSDLTGADWDRHNASRTFFHKTVLDTANSKGLKPIYWNIPGEMFDWTSGALVDSANKSALTGGSALPPPGSSATLNVSTTSVSFGSAAASQSVSITSNTSWTVSDNQTWLSVSPTSGSNNGSTSISVTANTSTSSRTGAVTISGGGITRTVNVAQSGTTATSFPAAGTYSLKNRSSSLMLDNLGVSNNGANVGEWADGSSTNQRWVLSYISSNVVKLQCVTGGRYLDGMGRTTAGSNVGQYDNGTSNNQRWTIIDVGSGYFKLKNVATGLCLDVGSSPWPNGDLVQQYPDGSSQNQHWQFVTP